MWPASCCGCSPPIRISSSRASSPTASPASRWRRPSAHLASAWPRDALPVPDADRERCCASCRARRCSAPHRTAPRPRLIDSLLNIAAAAGHAPRVVDISADYRFATAAAYETVYQHAHGAPQRLREFTCALPEHLAQRTDAACGAPGLLCDRDAAGERAAAEARAGVTDAVRQRRHRQHRFGAQAGRGHASSAAAQRPVRLQRAGASPCARGRGLCAGGIGRRGGFRLRAAFRTLTPAASMSRCKAP